MAQDLPPPPLSTPVIDQRNIPVVTPIWADWIQKAFVRMGGHIAPTNNDSITTARIDDLAITSAKIANAAVGSSKIDTSLAGTALSGGAGSPLSVQVDGSTITVTANKIGVPSGAISFAKLVATDWTASAATSGYQKLGSGLYIQWGVTGSIATATNTAQSFPATFPTACLQVIAGIQGNTAGATTETGTFGTASYSTSGFTLCNRTTASHTFNWIAIGY